jgi:hypothetical protein
MLTSMRRFAVILIHIVCLAISISLFFHFAVPAIGHAVTNGDQPYWVRPAPLQPAEDAAIRVYCFPFGYLVPFPFACLPNIVFFGAIPAWLILLLVRRWWPVRRSPA